MMWWCTWWFLHIVVDADVYDDVDDDVYDDVENYVDDDESEDRISDSDDSQDCPIEDEINLKLSSNI